jgi:hypothetical protein
MWRCSVSESRNCGFRTGISASPDERAEIVEDQRNLRTCYPWVQGWSSGILIGRPWSATRCSDGASWFCFLTVVHLSLDPKGQKRPRFSRARWPRYWSVRRRGTSWS